MNKKSSEINYHNSSVIKDNRIVSSTTFATRLTSFLKDVQVNCQAGEEELEYLQKVAKQLLLHQANTATSKEEKRISR